MALSRIKTWIAEVLTYADLNAEFNNILTNGPGSLGSPRTANFDLDGYTLILDADADTYWHASSDDIVDLYGQGTLLVRFDMSVSTPVNGLGFVASAASSHPDFTTRGADTNIGLRIQPKGTGQLVVDGGFAYVDSAGTVDAITATYAPAISALDDGLLLGFEATGANTSTTPTFAPNGLTAKTIVKGGNTALIAGDIEGDGHACLVRYSSRLDKWVLLNAKYPAGTAGLDLNTLTTDNANIGAHADYLTYVDVSAGNASLKGTVVSFLYASIVNATEGTTPPANTSYVLAADDGGVTLRKVKMQNLRPTEVIIIAVGDEGTTITAGTGKATFRMPFAMTLTAVRASLKTAAATGTFTVDINEGGSTILSTKLTIDATEKTSTTAATPAVISDTALADDAEITIDVDDDASNDAVGLKVALIGYRA